ncbi:MAG: DUF86 domain-containing protein [Candidatus Tagabacteria bacterium CG10_big_fil_rev_8_21_14_0_10_40_13]|uniref:DUF86 domain-containing protein n=1 Tax=Candidatus Tagabacteria bacterium CG10_big_fil_rev_8_21_14_0_10_40_13 TaxID=1975022 RepID=A0A2M8L9K2_9BACT|nr:MAG: DUF86 domain-containing protein [Candidatus Tagabacteria bacterium CG10_big_fil_rev_8_21_14_0_10_40_13]
MKGRNLLDKEKIIERMSDIKNAALKLKQFQKTSLKEFTQDEKNYPLTCFHLRIALEAVLTIATHIISRLPPNGKRKDYTQVILSLADYKVIPQKFAQKIKGMAGYRNRLVHLYWKVEPEEILATIKKDLKDFDQFIKHIETFLKK